MSKIMFYEIEDWEVDYIKKVFQNDAFEFTHKKAHEEECTLKEDRELLTEKFLKKYDFKTQLLNHVFLDRDDVVFTLHNAFKSKESVHQILDVTVENIKKFKESTI